MSDKLRKRSRPPNCRRPSAAIGYSNAGTVEFLMDEKGKLYFIEVNARMQVEHPVTEMVTGIDIVKARSASPQVSACEDILGGPIVLRGHAIECRINAENPDTFAPSPGRVTGFKRLAASACAWTRGRIGLRGSSLLRSLVAKLIAHGKDRGEAIRRMSRALDMFIIEGIHTSIPLHKRILADAQFQEGRIDTNYIPRLLAPAANAESRA